MRIENNHGVEIDVCRDHGIWLDKGELSKIISKISGDSYIRRNGAIHDAKTDGRYEGIFFGWLSLFMK